MFGYPESFPVFEGIKKDSRQAGMTVKNKNGIIQKHYLDNIRAADAGVAPVFSICTGSPGQAGG